MREVVVEPEEEEAMAPMIPDAPLVTVRINGGPFYPFNLWAASKELGIADELNIELDISSQGFFPTAALKRGEFEVIASCPACAFGVYESIPEFRNWITSYQWRGFQVIGRADPDTGAAVHKPWIDFFVDAGGDLEQANRDFSASLAGRSFAIWDPGSIATLKALLEQGDLTLDDVEIIGFADINVASTSFIAGEGDYHMGDSIQMHRMLTAPDLRDKFVSAAPFQAFGATGLWYSTFASTQDWLDANEETALRLLAIWYRTTRYLHNRTDDVLPPMHEAVRRAGGVIVSDEDLIAELFNIEDYVRFQDAWDHYFADGSPTNMDLSIAHAHKNAVEAGTAPADSDWRIFEVEKDWFAKLQARPDLVAWIMKPL
ncbi:MAG: ABC transporter substrate-binding protein [bacterium]|nr:ABC transporter substrate-binding protein [bacterium]